MPGVLWIRLKLPFRLNHVNIYLLADGDGWAMVDTGFGNEETIAAWTALFEGPLRTRPSRADRHPFASRSCRSGRLDRRALQLSVLHVAGRISAGRLSPEPRDRRAAQLAGLFFRRHGMDENLTDKLLGRGQDYLKRVSVLPPAYRRISHGDEISIGTRRFKVITGGGHSLGSGDAVLRRRQTVPVRRPGAEQDFTQCQRLGGRARREFARRISGFAGEPDHDPAL